MEAYVEKCYFASQQANFHVRTDVLSRGFPAHSHEYVELVVVLDGKARHVIDGVGFTVRAGNVYVIQGQTVHAFEEASPDFRICNVMFPCGADYLPQQRLRQLPGYQALFTLEPAYRHRSEFASHMQLSDGQFREVVEHLRHLETESANRRPGYECMVQAGILQLVVMLCRMVEQGAPTRPTRLMHLSSAVAHIERHYREPLDVNALAERAHMSRRHFFRAFHDAFGQSPLEYVMRLRMEHAARLLLARPELGIGAIAAEIGFEDSNYFARQFRRHRGCSPRAYRSSPARG